MNLLIISSSLSKKSHSRTMAEYVLNNPNLKNINMKMIDLRNHELPLCDGDGNSNEPVVKDLKVKIIEAQGILIATPIYNYNINAALKNLIELTGSAWNDKIVGFVCSAGGRSSYMSVMSLANSMMLDFRCIIIPRIVYSDSDSDQLNDSVKKRLDQLSSQLIRFVKGLKS